MTRSRPDIKADRFRPGMKTIPSRMLNKLVDGVNKPLIGVNAPAQPKTRGKSGGAAVRGLTLVSHEDDFLVCEDADSNEVLVAKPYELRRTPFEGQTVEGVTYNYESNFPATQERTAFSAANPSEEETQYITPAYVDGAEIYTIKVQGNTGVETGDSPSEFLTHIEMNQGRAWAWDEDA